MCVGVCCFVFVFQAEEGIRDGTVTGVQTCALPIYDVPRASASATAAVTAGWVCPRIIGPQEQTRSTYWRPSTSNRYGPAARSMNLGTPPTGPNARTGEFTPPGVTSTARANRAAERSSVTG